jgi:hypothetical protein
MTRVWLRGRVLPLRHEKPGFSPHHKNFKNKEIFKKNSRLRVWLKQ